MTTDAFTNAITAVGDTVRLHTTDAGHAVAILAAACAFEACNSKAPDITWAEVEKDVLETVARSLAVSRASLEKHAPNG